MSCCYQPTLETVRDSNILKVSMAGQAYPFHHLHGFLTQDITKKVVIVCLLGNNYIYERENLVKNIYLFALLLILLVIPALTSAGDDNTLILNSSGSLGAFGVQGSSPAAPPNPAEIYPGADRQRNGLVTTPVSPGGNLGIDGQGISSTPAPNPSGASVAIDREGHASVVTPSQSGGYLGFDRQGKGVLITPLVPGSRFGIDTQGNTWTIPPTQ